MEAIMNTKFKLFRNQKGMTLVELLAVIVILGVIAAIAVPAIGGTISSSKTRADAQSVLLLEEAAERYATDINPAGLTTTTVPSTTSSITTATLLAQGYIKSIPDKQSASPVVPYASVTIAYGNGWVATAVLP